MTTNKNKYIKLSGCCTDCAIAIAADDYSGMSEEKAQSVQDGIARIPGYLVTGDDLGFSWQSCSVCGTGLGGDRVEVGYLVEVSK